jgi:hypothetical protein
MKDTTVLGFYPALEAGYEPRNYSWLTENVPVGAYEAKLDFMIWSKKQVAINCYLTSLVSGQHFRLTAYRNKAEDYMAGDVAIRFLPFGSVLLVTVELNGSGNPKWINAVLIGTGSEEFQPVTGPDAQHRLEF